MRLRIVSAFLACSLVSGPAFADGIRASIPGAVERELAASSQRGRGENPMMIPGIALIGGGALLLVLGLVTSSGFECGTITATRLDCGTTKNKGLIFGGIGAAALGGILIMRGEKQRSSPYITPAAGGVVVGQRLSF